MPYSLCGSVLQLTNEAQYLGVTLTSDMEWSKHIQKITARSNSTLGLLRRNLSNCPPELREQAFISLVRSRLEYCSAVWDPRFAKDAELLESVQRRGARFVKQDYGQRSSVTAMLADLKWMPLKDRPRETRLALLFKILNGKVAVEAQDILDLADIRTRSIHDQKYIFVQTRCELVKQSFFPRTVVEWNKLPVACTEADSVPAFLASLRAAAP